MLRELRIQSFAIIDDLHIEFLPGFNVITGETGAGKSILVQAFALLCGARANADLIRGGCDEAVVEGLFEVALTPEEAEAAGIEDEDEILVRRRIQRNGKGRIHINGRPATAAVLQRLADSMVHLYGQHEQSRLLHEASHLEYLDAFAGCSEVRRRMQRAHAHFAEERERCARLQRERAALERQEELIDFQIRELEAASVTAEEDEELRREREVLRHGERLQHDTRAAEQILYSGEDAVTAELARVSHTIRALLRFDDSLGEVASLLEAARVQAEEAATGLRAYFERVSFDPERLHEVEERIEVLARLARKLGVAPSQLPARLEELRAERSQIESSADELRQAEEQRDRWVREASSIATELTAARRRAASELESCMGPELEALGMQGALRVVQRSADPADPGALGPYGVDSVALFVSTNRGEEPRPLARIASGGELSRILLALKARTAGIVETPILIFDEVDAGVGGAVADAVARRLRRLADTHQVLCITHLPQLAAHADHHVAVEKLEDDGRTVSRARSLNEKERVLELSRMLGGTVAANEARRYARTLLDRARR